ALLAQSPSAARRQPQIGITVTAIMDITATTTTMAAVDGHAVRVGLFRAGSVSPIGMGRGISMEGGRATTDGNTWGGRFGGFPFWPCAPAVRIASNPPRLAA